MQEMVKGTNVSLAALSEDTGSVILSLSWSSPTGDADADVSVIRLAATGKVRSDADFFFYNNPADADGSVQLLGRAPSVNGDKDRISVDLEATPTDVEDVRLMVFGDAAERALQGAARRRVAGDGAHRGSD